MGAGHSAMFPATLESSLSRKIEFLAETDEVQRGTTHPVTVRITLERATKIRGIHARFYAAERTEANYTETYMDAKGKPQTRMQTAVEYTTIADDYFHLAGEPKPGLFTVVGDALASLIGGGGHEIMNPGQYEFPIEIKVPENCPPTFKGKKSSVFYRLEVRVDVPIWPDPKRDHNFQVLNLPKFTNSKPVRIRHPDPSNGRGLWDKMFGKEVKADVALDRDDLIAGETFAGMIHLVPSEPINLDGIIVGLIGEEKSIAHGHRDHHLHVHEFPVVETPNNLSRSFTKEFEFTVPDLGLYTSRGTNYEINWAVKLRLDVPWAVDPVITIPIEYFG